jgi:putative ABC transport system permease protein
MIRVSLRDLQWRRRRFVIVVLVAAMAFGLALVMTGVTNQLSQEGTETVAMFDADRWVVAQGVGGPFTTSQLIPRDLTEAIAAEPEVDAASPILIGRTLIGDRDVNVVGYDPESTMLPAKLVEALARTSGSDGGDPVGAIADARFSHRTGERFVLGGTELAVVAEVEDTSFYFSTPTVFLPIEVVQDLLFTGEDVASAVVVDGGLTDLASSELAGSVSVLDNDDVQADFERVIAGTKDTIGIVNTLLWMMAAGIVAAIVYVSVLERTRDFATLKAIGTSTRSLVFGLVAQASVLSICSAIAAVGVCRAISPSFSFPVSVPSSAYVQLLVVALVVGVLASLAGVRKITHIDPALAFGGPS